VTFRSRYERTASKGTSTVTKYRTGRTRDNGANFGDCCMTYLVTLGCCACPGRGKTTPTSPHWERPLGIADICRADRSFRGPPRLAPAISVGPYRGRHDHIHLTFFAFGFGAVESIGRGRYVMRQGSEHAWSHYAPARLGVALKHRDVRLGPALAFPLRLISAV